MAERFDLSDESVVTRVCFDAAVRILIGSPDGEYAELVVNTTFALTVDETSTTASPSNLSAGDVALVSSLRWRRVYGLDLGRGELLTHGDRFSLSIPADPDYESWELIRSGGAITIGLPGGEISRNY
jgi:Family of unknown function (DUF6188)